MSLRTASQFSVHLHLTVLIYRLFISYHWSYSHYPPEGFIIVIVDPYSYYDQNQHHMVKWDISLFHLIFLTFILWWKPSDFFLQNVMLKSVNIATVLPPSLFLSLPLCFTILHPCSPYNHKPVFCSSCLFLPIWFENIRPRWGEL